MTGSWGRPICRIGRRTVPLAILALLVALAPTMQANPGGEGNDTRDFTCGGSCHGDPGLSQPSSAVIVVSLDRTETYAGGPLTVTATATGMELAGQRLVGAFLLSTLNGVDDDPESHGWTIIADGAGGRSNYVEERAFSSEEGVEVSWVLRAPESEGTHAFHVALHHGGGGVARLAQTDDPVNVTVGPVPENLPQMASSWEPVTTRGLGAETTLDLPVVNATTVTLEWRLAGGPTQSGAATGSDGSWSATLPAALGPSTLDYRVLMVNEEFSEATPWIELEAVEPGFMPDLNAVRLQMCALTFATAALAIALTRRLSRGGAGKARLAPASAGQTGAVTAAAPLHGVIGAADAPPMGAAPPPMGAAPPPMGAAAMPPSAAQMPQPAAPADLSMDDPRRPPGWTDEQWQHYGPDMIAQQGGGA